ncbi:MAG: CARDB domain-containing protein [Halobacteriota archaeon]
MNPRIFTLDSATLIILALLLLILVLITTAVTSAEVTELNVTPEVVLQGETLLVSGKASPGEEVWLNSSFEIALPVSDGEYIGEFNGIDIPAGEKKFSVTAENIKNIRMSIYPIFWQTIEYPLDGPLNATNGTATISISFPATWGYITIDIYGKKNVRVYGDAADSAASVNLTTEMSIKVTADSTGDFSLDINTEGVPPGEFLITAGGIEKTVYIVSAVEEKPDLVITEKWVCWPENCTICYNITNIGNGTAPAGHNTTLYVDGIEVAHDQVPVDLAPNESYIGCFEGYDWIYTARTIFYRT